MQEASTQAPEPPLTPVPTGPRGTMLHYFALVRPLVAVVDVVQGAQKRKLPAEANQDGARRVSRLQSSGEQLKKLLQDVARVRSEGATKRASELLASLPTALPDADAVDAQLIRRAAQNMEKLLFSNGESERTAAVLASLFDRPAVREHMAAGNIIPPLTPAGELREIVFIFAKFSLVYGTSAYVAR